MLKGTVCPVLARYRKFMWASRDIVEVASIIIQVGNDIQTYSRELPLLLEPKDVSQLTLKNLKKKYELDDEFYPNSDIVRIAINESIKEIEESKNKLLLEKDSLKIDKWPSYKEIIRRIEIYISSSPKDFIKVVKKDILE